MARDMQAEAVHDLSEIIRALGRIEGAQQAILMNQEEQKNRVTMLEEKVRSIETKVSYAAGAVAVLTVFFSLGWEVVRGLLRG
jgi:hypothetical protein